MNGGLYGTQNAEMSLQKQAGMGGQYQAPTRRQQLDQQRQQLMAAVNKIDAALAALDAHPELEGFIDTMQQAGV